MLTFQYFFGFIYIFVNALLQSAPRPPIIRVNDKVMIPQEEHPDINFVGLLIGPRGNTLKNLEKDVRICLPFINAM